MAISRAAMQKLFLKDADRQRKIAREAREKYLNTKSFHDRLGGGAIGAVTGAIVGGVTGGPAGALSGMVSGGAKGLTTDKRGFEGLGEIGLSSYAGSQALGKEGLAALSKPGGLQKASDFIGSQSDPLKTLQNISSRKRSAEKEKLKRKQDVEDTKSERDFEVNLEQLKHKNKMELQQLKKSAKSQIDPVKLTDKEITRTAIKVYDAMESDSSADEKRKAIDSVLDNLNTILSGLSKPSSVQLYGSEKINEAKLKIQKEIKKNKKLKDGISDTNFPGSLDYGENFESYLDQLGKKN